MSTSFWILLLVLPFSLQRNSFSTKFNQDAESDQFTEDLADESSKDAAESSGELDEQPYIRFLVPQDGSEITFTPFRVEMEIVGDFRVPEDGEVQLAMTYPGRGTQLRVLQGLEFNCWNVGNGEVEITAQLVTTRDAIMGPPTSIRVTQRPGPHFVLNSPNNGELYVAQRAVPIIFGLGGEMPEDFRVCCAISCRSLAAKNTSSVTLCTGDAGVEVAVADGAHRISAALPPGNCTAEAAVVDGAGSPITDVARRHFRVADDQAECPPDSGVACLHGECSAAGPAGRCVCDPGHTGPACSRPPPPPLPPARRGGAARPAGGDVAAAYLELVKAGLLDSLYEKDRRGETAVVARSMVGRRGLDDLQALVEEVLGGDVPGDLMETGVWQGGSCILMRAILKARGDTTRKVWVVDSFEGCPEPKDDLYPQDRGDRHHTYKNLAVPIHKVASNFEDFGLLDDQVEFLKGWFHESLQSDRAQGIESLALLRLDGDLYESTIVVLRTIYYKVSVGGYVVVDDWRLDGMQARTAVKDFFEECALNETVRVGPDGLAWWRKDSNQGPCG